MESAPVSAKLNVSQRYELGDARRAVWAEFACHEQASQCSCRSTCRHQGKLAAGRPQPGW
eukprot:5832935-Prymnesium_polylepis.1